VTFPSPIPEVPGLPLRRRFTDERVHIRPLTEDELQEWLEDTDDLQETIDLWDKLSGIPGLLNTRPVIEVKQQHGGPGPHKSGSPQSVHGGGRGGSTSTSTTVPAGKWANPGDVRSVSDLREVADISLPPDDSRFEYFYHSFRWKDEVDSAFQSGLKSDKGKVFLSKDEIRDRGAGFVIVRVPVGSAKEGIDFVEPGLVYREWTVSSVPASDIVRVVREVPIIDGGGHSIREDRLAAWFVNHQGGGVSDLPRAYHHWASLPQMRQQARRLAEIFFDAITGVWRYVVAGRRVPDFRIKMGVQRVANAVQRDLRELTTQLVNGEISRQQWYDSMRSTMKHEYRAAYLASIGGLENYDRSEISKFGWRMRPHYRWLNNFLAEIESGDQPLNGFAVMRAGMYARAANGIYENERMRVAAEAGYREARRKLGPNENHCETTLNRPGCIDLAAMGWIPIDQMIPIGAATCLSHCLCGMEFRK